MGTLEVTSKPLVILHGERKRKSTKRKKLEAKGYKVTDSAEWLGLSREEAQIVDMRVALAQELERVRKAKGITQAELAKRVGTKQSGVARMLNNPDTSTMDNLIKALIALGEPISKIAACLLLCSNNGPLMSVGLPLAQVDLLHFRQKDVGDMPQRFAVEVYDLQLIQNAYRF